MSFITIYGQDYDNPRGVAAKIIRPESNYPDLGDVGIQVIRSREDELNLLAANQRERMRTVYDVSYGRRPEEALKPIIAGDEFMLGLRNTYSPERSTVMPIRPTMRRIFGYFRTDFLYQPLTTYQDEIGGPAYKRLTVVRKLP